MRRSTPRLMLLLASSVSSSSAQLPDQLFDPLVAQKLQATFQSQPSVPSSYPQYTTRDTGKWLYFSPGTWTSGFLPATFYAMEERAELCPKLQLDRDAWLAMGRSSATSLIPIETHNTVQHDVGFLSFPFVEELRVNKDNETAKEAVNAFAQDLAARYSPVVGCTRSWDTADATDFQVIIDNMMNLNVLFRSEELTGNHTLRDIAISHADKTIANHVRADGGSFHVVDYNATTGQVFAQRTAQGYSNSSTWARGQAWGIYGFTLMYENTKLDRYIETARRMADYFISHIPADGIVPWDFNAPPAGRPADSSAATIAASGLLLLAKQEQSISNYGGAEYYKNAAVKIISDVSVFFRSDFQSLLSNGTVNNPAGNNLTGTVYGDYYFVWAGNELVKQGLANC